ncbi:putative cullin 3 [Trypanosoma cruzi]|nr:putative cullin 3 [Trypanosoma cruzi]
MPTSLGDLISIRGSSSGSSSSGSNGSRSGSKHDSGGCKSDAKRVDCSCIRERDVFSRLQDRPSVNDLWPGVESYLVHAAHTIRTGSAEMMDRLRDVRHRMNWYAVIYSVCSGHPQNSSEVYHRLSLFLLNDLEVNVLRQFLRRNAPCGSPPSSSLCLQFVQQYKLFMAFRRVVLSCFSYLDQYFTAKFRLDPVTALCVKLFYFVVYEPMKEALIAEVLELADAARTAYLNDKTVSSACSDVQQTLLSIVEILSTVKAFSAPYDANTQSALTHQKKDNSNSCNYKRGVGEGRNMLAAFAAKVVRMQSPSTAPNRDPPRTMGESPRSPLNKSQNSDHCRVERQNGSEGHSISSSPLAKDWDAMAYKSLDGIRMLRERLERRSFGDLMAAHVMRCSSRNKSSHQQHNNGAGIGITSGGCEGGSKCSVDSAGVVIVEITQPLHFLIFAEFGLRYVQAAETYYRNRREMQFSTPEGRMDYIPWVQGCLAIERSLMRDVNAPLLLSALRERIHHVLLVEVHRSIILAKEVGFRAQLDAWDSNTEQGAGDMWKDGSSSSSSIPPMGAAMSGNCSDVDAATSPAAFFSAQSTNPWEQLSREELGDRIKEFVATFVSTQDEACWTLLASEFASKVVVDTAALFFTYMSQVEALAPQQLQQGEKKRPGTQQSASSPPVQPRKSVIPMRRRRSLRADGLPSDSNFLTQQDLAMALIKGLVDTSIHYNKLICEKFNEHPPMQVAMGDAMRELLNPERWGQLVVGGAMHGGVAAVNRGELPSVLLNHDAAKKTVAVLNSLATMRGSREIAVPQFLAMYCDQLCRREMDDGVTDPTDHILYLITLVDDKDVFLEHYKLLLARRLLFLPSAQRNMDREHVMMHKMHHALGRTLTYGLEAMLRDHEVTASMNEEFSRSDVALALPTRLRVQVLTSVHWPTYRVVPLTPCDSLALVMKTFTDYYIGVHPSRMLHWIHTLGTATLHAVFPKGDKEVIANNLQAHILILISDAYNMDRGGAASSGANDSHTAMAIRRSLSGREIATAMGMEFCDIYMYLAPLVKHKLYNLLVRVDPSAVAGTGQTTQSSPPLSPPNARNAAAAAVDDDDDAAAAAAATHSGTAPGQLLPEDHFTLNVEYTHKLRKFGLPVARPSRGEGLKGSVVSSTHVENTKAALSDEIEASRRIQMDAAIVRIMKSRRSLRYYELFDLTVQQLSKQFVPRPRSVKMQVEDLVCRGFLRRSEKDTSVFEYMA